MKKLMIIFFSYALFLSCHKPDEIGYEIMHGKILKKVTCDNDPGKDLWIIQFIASPGYSKEYGTTVQIDSNTYNNVVYTDFNLERQSLDTTIYYSFGFDISQVSNCKVTDNQNASITKVTLREVFPISTL